MNRQTIIVSIAVVTAALSFFLLNDWGTVEPNAEHALPENKVKQSSKATVQKTTPISGTPVRKPSFDYGFKTVAEEEVPASLRKVFGLDGCENDYQRIQAVSTLGKSLSINERNAVYSLLRNEENGENMLVVKNNLLNKLRNQNSMPPELTSAMISMAGDKNLNDIVRAYVIQHLRPQYRDVSDADQRRAIVDTFTAAIGETDKEVAGNALLAMENLSQDFKEISREDVAQVALDMADDDSVKLHNRIAAVAVCGDTGNADALDTVKDLALSDQQTVLKLSAIGTLGKIGGEDDLEQLEQLLVQEPKLFQQAAQAAIKNIKSRIN